MVITVSTEKEYVYQWVQLLQPVYKISERELQVAQMMVYRFVLMGKGKNTTAQAMKLLKSESSLLYMCDQLGMNFSAFRRYLQSLKDKGFFDKKSINPLFIPDGRSSNLEVVWK